MLLFPYIFIYFYLYLFIGCKKYQVQVSFTKVIIILFLFEINEKCDSLSLFTTIFCYKISKINQVLLYL